MKIRKQLTLGTWGSLKCNCMVVDSKWYDWTLLASWHLLLLYSCRSALAKI